MPSAQPQALPQALPGAFDPAAAERLLGRFAERDAMAQGFAASPAGRPLLESLGGHSP